MSTIGTVVIAVFLLAGALAALSAGLGMVLLPDLASRMHAATKPQAIGIVLILVAVAVKFPSPGVLTTIVLIVLLQLTTVPVAAQLVGRAAYRSGQVRSDHLYLDELEVALRAADAGAAPPDED
ncbi:monovalent cation/H(+) antiporter subunit G [Actinomadura atramentaria]|uniref:monovalent cation/H(+) antiporter subunit G n=1 Tax=Actinomadura atramentaria TaxID=1990 RepID=UPI00036A2382|nr:monovalent cation/H(+) antiporter subunit G [Actinomadura atramentaria]